MEQKRRPIEELLRAEIARSVGVAPSTIRLHDRFRDLGLDSGRAVELLTAVGEQLQLRLPASLLWRYPTIAALAAHLSERRTDGEAAFPGTTDAGSSDEPIAIVGMSCRLPGARSVDELWRLLAGGVDAITEVPPSRWPLDAYYDSDPSAPGRMSTRWGGFLERLDAFDAAFFGISPREAAEVDPLQRLMLELAWEALEDGGVAADRLRGSAVGVFIGAMGSDFARLFGAEAERIEQHSATGHDTSIISARISYALGLQGPSLTVNSACSSSLVAVHLACQSLRSGESSIALAGGVNLLLSPWSTVAMSKLGVMAPDGRCKTFDARANGYVRSEGGGLVLLKRLSRALADGDPIRCVVRGSATNNDGFSNGLTAPNPRAQEELLREACRRAGVDPRRVTYVEAHGTGTALGDPIEAGALGAVLGTARRDEPALRIGSVKTNIGHTEAAAGVAGLLKVALALEHRTLPPSLHFERPSPQIAFDALRLRVQSRLEEWPEEEPPLAGVSSFGFGGTNCHVVVERLSGEDACVLPLAADDAASLGAQIAEALARLAGAQGSMSLRAFCASYASRSAEGAVRRAFVASTYDSLARQLREPGTASATPRPAIAFVFPGHGSASAGMGRRLLTEPAFRNALDPELREALAASSGDVPAADRQTLVFGLQTALVALWRSWGIEPDIVIGHSMGEIAAAATAGILGRDDAARLVASRARLTATLTGGMAVAGASPDELEPWIEGSGLRIAGRNGERSTLLSGDEAALGQVLARLRERGIAATRIEIGFASHSPAVEAIREEFLGSLRDLRPRDGRIPFVSTVDACLLRGRDAGPHYWYRNLREPVRFHEALGRLEGETLFVEIGARPVFASQLAGRGECLPSLRSGEDGREAMLRSLARLYERGAAVRWNRLYGFASSPPGHAHLLTLSAHDDQALDEAAAALAALCRTGVDAADVCFTAAAHRTHHRTRLAAVGQDARELAERLEQGNEVTRGQALDEELRIAAVFPGHGNQWIGMGCELARSEPVFRRTLEECGEALSKHVEWSLLEELERPEETSRLRTTPFIQPALFAVQCALAALWRSWGITPGVVIGHSMGEVAAAHVAGMLTLDDAARIIATRSRLVAEHAGPGAMAMVELSEEQARELLAGLEDRLAVGVVNSPRASVLSGDPEALAQVLETLQRRGVFCRRLDVDYASHCPQMARLEPLLLDPMAGLAPRSGTIPFYSATDDRFVDGESLDASYWVRNLTRPVRFASAVRAVRDSGADVFLEMSPHPSLVAAVEDCLRHGGKEGRVLGSMHRHRPERASLLASLGVLYTLGAKPVWSALSPPTARRVALPHYPWQRERHWPAAAPSSPGLSLTGGRTTSLLGAPLESSIDAPVRYWHSTIGVESFPHLADHQVHGRVVFPAAGYAVMAAESFDGVSIEITGLTLEQPLLLGSDPCLVQTTAARADDGDAHSFTVASRGSGSWTRHASATVRCAGGDGAQIDLAAIRGRCPEAAGGAAHYAALAGRGLGYGDAFRAVVEVRRGDGEALARLEPCGDPALSLLDGALQLLVFLAEGTETRIPAAIERLILRKMPRAGCWAWAGRDGAIVLFDDAGRILVEASGVSLRSAPALAPAAGRFLHRRWARHRPAASPARGGAWLVVGGEEDLAHGLGRRLGGDCRLVRGDGGAEAIRDAVASRPEWTGVVHLDGCAELLHVVQGIVAASRRRPPRLFVVTRGAERLAGDGAAVAVADAPQWGFGRTVAYEHPELRCRRIDLSPRDCPGELDRLAELLFDSSTEEELAIRPEGCFHARVVRGLPQGDPRPLAIDPEAAYLITGGFGFAGRMIGQWLVDRGARHLTLIGRSIRDSAEVEAWRAAGVDVQAIAADVADREELAAAIEATAAARPLRGAVHAAGVLDDGVIVRQDAARLASMLAAKAYGAWHLHELTSGQPLDSFLLVSSAMALVGSPGQSSYTAANAYLDALARHRAALGLPATSVAFGPIAGGGLAAETSARGERLASRGMRSLAREDAVAHLGMLMERGVTECAVVDVDPRQWIEAHPQLAGSGYLSELGEGQAAQRRGRTATRLQLTAESLPEQVAQVVRETLAVVTRIRPDAIDGTTRLSALGLDSLLGLELRNRLEAAVGVRLPVSLVWSHPDVRSLTAAVVEAAASEIGTKAPAAPALVRRNGDEAVAVIGMACRFPGNVDSPEAFWQLLVEGRSAIEEIPDERWGGAPRPRGSGARHAGLLHGIDRFDAPFFGIAPREAASMDPQQRLLLEVAWEALEHGGQHTGRLQQSRCGVFVGMMANDYRDLLLTRGEGARDLYAVTGNGHPFAAGRLSYALGLNGPSLAVDTACSSSLVAVHLACRSLREGESDLALACGANLILSPAYMSMLTTLNTLAPDGRCKVFDARANGYVRGEGVAVLVLARVSDALRRGDRIWAVIRGTAVNQDGRSAGLTAPNRRAQESVIRRALEEAALTPDDIDYLEAHGTGTPLGDPIEVDALRAVFAGRRRPSPCGLGSVKANVGHLEGAAGMAALIKSILVLDQQVIPPQIELESLNPRISLEGTPFFIPGQPTPLPPGERRRIGVSGFGLSGTNAHTILEEPPRVPQGEAAPPAGALLVPLTARHPEALRELAAAHRRTAHASLTDVAHTLATRREHHRHRLAVAAATRREFDEALDAFLSGAATPFASSGEAPLRTPKIGFVFPGQGSQWLGMGRESYRAGGAFRERIDECDAHVRKEAGWSPVEELFAAEDASRLDRIDAVQPLLFSMQVALAAQWQAWGVRPDAVVGHSMGEVAAAVVAGALTLADGVTVICRRSALMARLGGRGAMALVELPASEAAGRLRGRDLTLAALNGPRSTVIAGAPEAVDDLLGELTRDGVFCRPMKVTVASHSPHVDPLRDELHAALRGIAPRAGSIPIASTVDAALVDGSGFDAAYWQRNLREPVRFQEAVERVLGSEGWLFIDVGPHPLLVADVKEILAHRQASGTCIASLRRDRPSLLVSAGEAFTHGAVLDWEALAPSGGRCVVLPRYPWQRERFWIEAGETARPASAAGEHPLLGAPFGIASRPGARFWAATASPGYLREHVVHEAPLLPAAAYVEMALSASRGALESIAFATPLVLPFPHAIEVCASGSQVTISSSADGTHWTEHARAAVAAAPDTPETTHDLDAIRGRCTTDVSPSTLYERFASVGLTYGPSFRTIVELRRNEAEALALVALPPELDGSGYAIHPTVLDGCLQALAALAPERTSWIPAAAGAVRRSGPAASRVWCHARLRPRRDGRVAGDVAILDEDGRELMQIAQVSLHPLDGLGAGDDASLHRIWEPAGARPLGAVAGTWLVLADRTGTGDALAAVLRERGADALLVHDPPADFGTLLRTHFRGTPCAGIVHLWSLDNTPGDLEGAFRRGSFSVVELVQAVGRMPWRDAPRLVLVTRGAQAAVRTTDLTAPEQAPVWGLGRVLAVEHPELACTRIDLAAEPSPDEVRHLLAEIAAEDEREDEIAIRPEGRMRGRLVQRGPAAADEPFVAEAGAFRLRIGRAGAIDAVELRRMQPRAPRPGEVRIDVDCCGINFRDVLKTLGALPEHALGRSPETLGYECSGRVAALGEGVRGLRIGDEVMAVSAGGTAASSITVPAALVLPRPRALTAAEAATVPIAFLTALHALERLARLEKGERVLIHAAAGGVGLAAAQWAQHIGADVFATAGSEERRDALRALGIERVADSRSASFADDIRRWTGGEGVDVVLNSLAGELRAASFALLRDGGRFIELGVRDDAPLPLAGNRSYFTVDLLRTIERQPDAIGAALRDVLDLFERGAFRALPTEVVPAGKAHDALRKLAEGSVIGRVALSMSDSAARPLWAISEAPVVRGDATYLVTGGSGGLGSAFARWLCENGARHLILLSRRAGGAVDLPADVAVVQADVADAETYRGALDEALRHRPPLRGVFHAAGVIDDATLARQNWERFRTVAAAKIAGAWLLHEWTRALDLDFFVLCSSMASLLGTPGQANYAAANAFLDALAFHRRASGLPATSIQWGPISGAGIAAETNAGGRLADRGLASVSPERAMEAVGRLMDGSPANVGAATLDVRQWLEFHPQLAGSSYLASLIAAAKQPAARGTRGEPREVWAGLAPRQRLSSISEVIAREAAKVLRMDVARLRHDAPLASQGLDSLTGLELRNRLEHAFGVPLSASLLWRYPEVAGLAAHFDRLLGFAPAGAGP